MRWACGVEEKGVYHSSSVKDYASASVHRRPIVAGTCWQSGVLGKYHFYVNRTKNRNKSEKDRFFEMDHIIVYLFIMLVHADVVWLWIYKPMEYVGYGHRETETKGKQ
jgi:hypothetical protein